MKSLRTVFLVLGFVALLFSSKAWSYGTGISTYPLMMDKSMLSAEFTGITSDGGGVGLQGRLTHKVSQKVVIDGGIGMAGGERNSRIFAGADIELYPDYMKQPRVSLKTTFENAEEFDTRRNILGVAPTVSKGFSFWGEEAYPFISLPYKIGLNSDTQTYQTQMSLDMGINGSIPVDGYRHLTGTVEANIDLDDSYTAIFLGVSYAIN